MTTVIDASVAIKWVLQEPDSPAALRLLTAPDLISPSFWLAEVANALWKHALLGEIQPDHAETCLSVLRIAPVTATPLEDDIDAALTLANRLGHPIYDCLYLSLAIRKRCQVVTADKRFLALAGKRANLTKHIAALI